MLAFYYTLETVANINLIRFFTSLVLLLLFLVQAYFSSGKKILFSLYEATNVQNTNCT